MNKTIIALALCCLMTGSTVAQKVQKNTVDGWHHGSFPGSNMTEALRFAQAQKLKVKKTVTVGVLDSGLDTTLVSLKTALWTNVKEQPDGRDNDRNGYIDDRHGWNFIGTADGSFNLTTAGTEEYREFKRLYPKYKNTDEKQETSNSEYAYYLAMRKKARIDGYMRAYMFAIMKNDARRKMDSLLRNTDAGKAMVDTLTVQTLKGLRSEHGDWMTWLQANMADLLKAPKTQTWPAFKKQQDAAFALMGRRIEGIEKDKDKRLLMGDDMTNANDRFYGNANLGIEGWEHGTAVAGIIAGRVTNSEAFSGLFPQAKVMAVRCVPDGDEYDKDVASAIRYAVDNGAKVINMSLGKYTSPQADMVNKALQYAAQKDVLVVQAAGNSHLDIDTLAFYPQGVDVHGERLPNFIRVGALGRNGEATDVSNYGEKTVDIFAPGKDIAVVFPNNKRERVEGTSVAAPQVAAVAAMLRSFFPKLSAPQVKKLLMETARPMSQTGLSVSGGALDALAALKAATKR